jgi:23S rRNA (cytidine1920-2'-O)/16S rRNA (cytidine1409-2'-O)-methyltransferase
VAIQQPIPPREPFVSRGGLKLRHALDAFALDVTGLTCADFGCSTGGFTDCLLKAGVARVYAIDTAYGELAWTLRKDPRVAVMERTNALHAELPNGLNGVDLVVADAGWTTQKRLAPAFLRWMAADSQARRARCISLIKPHYEAHARDPKGFPKGGVLTLADAQRYCAHACDDLCESGLVVLALAVSPITGGKHSTTGNTEFLALIERT